MSGIEKPRPLPKIEELYANTELAEQQTELNRLLNCQPKTEWIRENKFANNSKYIPVGIVEYLLTSIFLKWRLEVKGMQVIANSVVVTVRLYVQDPFTGEWDWQDGVGGSPIQTASGAAATDFSKVNVSAVQMAAPAAETYAFKDAAEKFGKIFGKDLNRKDEMNYQGMLEARITGMEKLQVPDALKDVIATADKENLANILTSNPELKNNPEFIELLNNRRVQLNKFEEEILSA